jgi:glycolate oxidase FAD binding subunit
MRGTSVSPASRDSDERSQHLSHATTTTLSAAAAAVHPRDAADLAEILASHPRALEPLGAGTKRALGCPVSADALDLSALRGIEVYEPAELVLTARAATPLAAVEAALTAQSQRLAFDPPTFNALLGVTGEQTLGGVLAANLAGSRRVSAGAARDHFLGCSAVNGRGELFNAGGRVVKNVTGYDVPKLLAGSWGTLAVLATVTLRVAPAPETERTLLVSAATPEDAVAVLVAALGSPHDVAAAAYDPAVGCLLRLEGFAPSVAARAAALSAALRSQDIGALEAAESHARWGEMGGAVALARWPVVWRISVPPTDAPRVLAVLEPDGYLLDWGGGLIWAGFGECDAARVRGAVRTGHATLFKAPSAVRAANSVFQPQAPAIAAVARRLKDAFDPDGRLNPGKLG